MPFENSNASAKIWAIVEIVEHIALFSGSQATAILSCTCAQLRSSITKSDRLWHAFYQHAFFFCKDNDDGWLSWRLNQEYSTLMHTDCVKDEHTKNYSWWQRYSQRKKLHMNWLENKPTKTFNIIGIKQGSSPMLTYNDCDILATCPGWIALTDRYQHWIYLIELSPIRSAIVHTLTYSEKSFTKLTAVFSTNHQKPFDDKEKKECNLYLILHMFFPYKGISELQLWNVSNRQLSQTIQLKGRLMGKIIGLSLLQCEIERGCFSPPPYDSFISLITNIIPTKNRKVQFIDIPKKNKSSRCIIQSVYEDFVILLRYSNYLPSDSYDVIKVPTNTLSDEVANNESQQIITLSSNCFSPSNGMRQLSCNFHRLDQNRALFHNPMQFVGSNGKQQYTDYIAVLSVSNGLVWEASYPGERRKRLIFMPEHNLFAILYSEWPIIVVISLLDGSIKHKIGTDFSLDKFSNFERCFDTLIVGYYLKASQYCIVNLATGQHSIHLFPISNVTNCKPTFGHMLIRNSNELQAISFVPEPI